MTVRVMVALERAGTPRRLDVLFARWKMPKTTKNQ
jgi:hypothetical protein